MTRRGTNISLKSYEDIFTTEEKRQETGEQVVMIPVNQIHEFKNHPFKVLDDEDMRKTVDSIREYGVLVPVIIRPDGNGEYEMISGHRRRYASIMAGKKEVPAIIREMDDDTATILMVDSNLQREHILPSERAKAYKMKMEALKHQGKRTDLTSCQVGTRLRADEELAKQTGESARTVQRFVRLNNLIPELLDLVDEKKIAFNPAVEISYMKPEEQKEFYEAMEIAQTTPSLSQAQRLKKSSQEGNCTAELIERIMDEEKKNPLNRVVFDSSILQKYFPQKTTAREMEMQILQLLEQWAGNRV
ncbi:ParB/RepB/Spo0J family partition protein [Butyrivibrio fibrisolvens]|uniref:ParB/RepB/Spo0J family partition protein n=1 Tax=Butyrivibrio fibrisolvens TaxID=831 RepID=UPI0003FD7422|nr:ParB/RepB/Spo0J family partition protein [Butyrivibrio fibrisolvens]